ncbi:MAG: DUF1858 domain-containing protein [Stappiaceae bacterium]
MAAKPDIDMGMTMDVIMARAPEVIPVLIKNNMQCVGCLLAPFHDVGDAAFEHGLNEDELLKQLQAVRTKTVA